MLQITALLAISLMLSFPKDMDQALYTKFHQYSFYPALLSSAHSSENSPNSAHFANLDATMMSYPNGNRHMKVW